MAYTGDHEATQSVEEGFFDHSCAGTLIANRPCLVVKQAWKMEVTGIVENILIQ